MLENKKKKNSMNDKYPLFTVIIPQKNRAEYLEYTLKTCMIQDYPNFEVIVSDDNSDDNSVEVIKKLQKLDHRIKLLENKTHIGMRDNFERALSEVRPGYVMALGGDDGLVPGCIWRMYHILKDTGKELLAWDTPYFVYPDNNNGHSKFIIRKHSDMNIIIIKSEDFLNRIAKSLNYYVDECPMFYVKGVASTKIVDKVKSRTKDGCFYYCPTPDGFSGVILAGEVEDYAYTNEPLSIMGTSPKSQGKNYHRTDEKSKREAQEFFNDNVRRTMHKKLASQQYSPLVTLMTADYLFTARDFPGWKGKFDDFTIEHVLRQTFKFLEKSSFENEVLIRELRILKEIAIQHDLLSLYEKLIKTTKRKVVRKDVFSGTVITRQSIILDGQEMGMTNIFEASLAVNFSYHLYHSISFKELCNIIIRMINTLINYVNCKVEYLPKI